MDSFGVFGIIPIAGQVNGCNPDVGNGKASNKAKDRYFMPDTPSVFKEKLITSGLFIASLPVLYMIVQS
ncbi:hypothetical protein [Xenorhabdus sp. KJ12.1]|uniref:hypothetical protein n=1 Tax=Xenorhabdus sp. KJ12.1 TaxID=1851571 RepID=UPI000C053EC7|nr:hypothetical protein [Xenorhabdus sp. KJ12.1]PHM72217.1 hypothetical protein Xekj_00495 [Xenorhabdus sp. KJ12.1]